MKVGHIIGGLEVVDVKRVNKLNLIQFLKEVDSYLQQGYQLDVTSGRQVGLVLMADMFKTEAAYSSVASKEAESVPEELSVPEPQSVQSTNVEDVVEPVEAVIKEEAPVAPKKTTTRSKKTAQ